MEAAIRSATAALPGRGTAAHMHRLDLGTSAVFLHILQSLLDWEGVRDLLASADMHPLLRLWVRMPGNAHAPMLSTPLVCMRACACLEGPCL